MIFSNPLSSKGRKARLSNPNFGVNGTEPPQRHIHKDLQKSVIKSIVRFLATLALLTSAAAAEPFKEVTVGVPVASVLDAEAWYIQLLGADVETIRPAPGVVEFKIAPTVWLQIFEPADEQSGKAAIRFMVEDITKSQAAHANAGINSGEAIEVPGIITYSEFADPDGNSLGLYQLP